jgi:PAS domain S-box-containing protein
MPLEAITDMPPAADARHLHASLLDVVDDGVGLLDAQGVLRLANPALAELLGRDPGERSTEPWRKRIAAGEHAAWDAAFALACRGERASCATLLCRPDGHTVPVEISLRPLRGAGGVDAIALIAVDPMRRQGNDEMLRWIARATAPLTGDDFFHTLTRHFAAAFGLRRAFIAECVDQPITRVRTLAYWYDAQMRPNFEFDIAGTPCERTIRDGRIHCMSDGLGELYPRARTMRLDGYLGAPIHDTSGRLLIGHVAFETEGPLDVGILASPLFHIFVSRASAELRRKRAEEQARQHLQRLAHVGRISAMGAMGSAIAHEINQPLTAVRTYAQACRRLLAAGEAPQALAETLERVAHQAERAGEIIQRLRGFLAQHEVRSVPVDPNALVREVIDLCRAEAVRCGVQLRLDLATEALPQVQADPIQIEQIVLNLVRNGIEAIHQSGSAERVLTVSTRRREREAWVSVHDSGPGVAPGVAARIFETFFTTKPDGMGVGLALSRSIAEAHQGRLWLDETAGGGALFHLALPALADVDGDGA